jgi:predicted RNase H-like nuclease (RuvC/YqgF family)
MSKDKFKINNVINSWNIKDATCVIEDGIKSIIIPNKGSKNKDMKFIDTDYHNQKIEELQNQLYISDKAHQRVCAENVELEQKIEELQKENTNLKEHVKDLVEILLNK